jgi:nuclear respiratory factor 1
MVSYFAYCRKLKMTIEEYTIRVGQQAVVLCCTPGKQGNSGQAYKVFGSQPLENVV